uniref:Uncharacterized protein n=1 Tax=Gadus morhua TaxID=8049 RepID=A0A8C5CN95_GADMO
LFHNTQTSASTFLYVFGIPPFMLLLMAINSTPPETRGKPGETDRQTPSESHNEIPGLPRECVGG